MGHLLSVKAGKGLGLTEDELAVAENLAAMCDACNLGLSAYPGHLEHASRSNVITGLG